MLRELPHPRGPRTVLRLKLSEKLQGDHLCRTATQTAMSSQEIEHAPTCFLTNLSHLLAHFLKPFWAHGMQVHTCPGIPGSWQH